MTQDKPKPITAQAVAKLREKPPVENWTELVRKVGMIV